MASYFADFQPDLKNILLNFDGTWFSLKGILKAAEQFHICSEDNLHIHLYTPFLSKSIQLNQFPN